jgi:hypothetical protein
MFGKRAKEMPTGDQALPGRADRVEVPERHFVNGSPLAGPFPEGLFLGGGTTFLAATRRLHDLGRVCRRGDTESHLRGGLHRSHRSRRGGTGRLPTRRDLL